MTTVSPSLKTQFSDISRVCSHPYELKVSFVINSLLSVFQLVRPLAAARTQT